MSKRRATRIPFRDALACVSDDMPDGAYFAMAQEIAGLEYGDGFDELARENERAHKCATCGRRFRTPEAVAQHARDKHAGAPTP